MDIKIHANASGPQGTGKTEFLTALKAFIQEYADENDLEINDTVEQENLHRSYFHIVSKEE